MSNSAGELTASPIIATIIILYACINILSAFFEEFYKDNTFSRLQMEEQKV